MMADRILDAATTTTNTNKPPETQQQQPQLKCPRCDSSNTKFCYYNNYSLSQPRHFCKACKRYWTRGGTLRNVPVGGGCRKNKRGSGSGSATKKPSNPLPQPPSQQPIANRPVFYSSPLDAPGFMIPGQLNYNLLGLGFHHLQPSSQPDLPPLHYPHDDYHALLHFDDLEAAGAKRIKLEGDANAANQLDWQLPCENSFGSVSAAASLLPADSPLLYWNTAGAWPDAANFGSSVSPLI